MHEPVLLNEVVQALALESGKFIIDGTVGSGGHAKAIIERLGPDGTFLGVDWDGGSIKRLERELSGGRYNTKHCVLKNDNYANLPVVLERENLGRADGVLLDLGFSSEQLESGRGFSFNPPAGGDEPLLMTYSDGATPLYQVLRQLNKLELAEIIRDLSDEKYASRIAEAIWERERSGLIRTSGDLAEIVRSALPNQYERGRIDPATRTFQALRMFVNDELGNLEKFLKDIKEIVKRGGRVVIISFHSKEDRIVKNTFRDMANDGGAILITKKPIQATTEEIKENPRSRSAKLRAIEIV